METLHSLLEEEEAACKVSTRTNLVEEARPRAERVLAAHSEFLEAACPFKAASRLQAGMEGPMEGEEARVISEAPVDLRRIAYEAEALEVLDFSEAAFLLQLRLLQQALRDPLQAKQTRTTCSTATMNKASD